MAIVKPFCAIRPNPELSDQIISNSFESYSEEELAEILKTNPNSFLQILTAGGFSEGTSVKNRYQKIRKKYQEFRTKKRYLQDSKPAFFVYQIKNGYGTFTGIIARTSTNDYEANVIKKHEEIIHKRRKNFAAYLKAVGFNADPVLLTYEPNTIVDATIKECICNEPDYNFNTDQTNHQLWMLSDALLCSKIEQEFEKISELYIADGHHRCASSSELARNAKAYPKQKDSYEYFMSYLICESQLDIHEFHRLITDLNGFSTESFLTRIAEKFTVEKMTTGETAELSEKDQFSMYLDRTFFRLTLKRELYTSTDILGTLTPEILNRTILRPLLGIEDARTDDRITCYYAKNATAKMISQVDNGTYKVGFGMYPVTIEEVKKVAKAGLKMPPKSTYVVPKLPSGLLLYEF